MQIGLGSTHFIKYLLFVFIINISVAYANEMRVSGELQFGGIPMSSLSSIQPEIECRYVSNSQPYTGFSWDYNPQTSEYTIADLPAEKMGLMISFPISGDDITTPTNFRTWHMVDFENNRDPLTDYHIQMQQIMHLTAPWDNFDYYGKQKIRHYHTYQNPIYFQWDPVWQATRYELLVSIFKDDYHPDGHSYVVYLNYPMVEETYYWAELPPSNVGEHYEVSIKAFNDEDQIVGYYLTSFTNGHRWEYPFKVSNGMPFDSDPVPSIMQELDSSEEPNNPYYNLGHFQLSGKVLFNNIPLSEYTKSTPAIWARSRLTGDFIHELDFTYDPNNAEYAIKGLPYEKIGLGIRYHLTGIADTLPGNMERGYNFDISGMDEKRRTTFDLNLVKIMRLVQPFDTSDPAPYAGSYIAPYHSPLLFEWQPLTEAKSYQVVIDAYRDPNHADGWGYHAPILNHTIDQNWYDVELPVSKPHEYYRLKVYAISDIGQRIGYNMSTYTYPNGLGHGWDYRFKIIDSGIPTAVMPQLKKKIEPTIESSQTVNQELIVTVSDKTLLEQLCMTLDDDVVRLNALSNLETLNAPNLNIDNISGLGYAENLVNVDLSGNRIHHLGPLTWLNNIQSLNLKGNPLNTPSYCNYLPQIIENNPGMILQVNPNPNPVTNDCRLELEELISFFDHWLETDCHIGNNWCNGADALHKGVVDMQNLSTLIYYWDPD